MEEIVFERLSSPHRPYVGELRRLLEKMEAPFRRGDRVGIKLHWGERENRSFLPPDYAREISLWVKAAGAFPFLFDTTVLYSGGRRKAEDSLQTAAEHGYTEGFLGCPVVIADGMDGRSVVDLQTDYSHFSSVQVADIFDRADGYVIFSHFKGHMEAGFGGAIKNLSMGFASRAQKQRMHADIRPLLKPGSASNAASVSTSVRRVRRSSRRRLAHLRPRLSASLRAVHRLCPNMARKSSGNGRNSFSGEARGNAAASGGRSRGAPF